MNRVESMSDDELGQRLRQAVEALPDAPPALRRMAVDLFPAAAQAQPLLQPMHAAAGAVLRRVTALLSFDSWATPGLALGMRSLRTPTRHMLFSAMGRDIDLRISPAAEAFSLAGQILGPDDRGSIEVTATPAGSSHVAELDPMGEFRIDGVRAGTYRLTLRMGSDEIVLPPVEVGSGG